MQISFWDFSNELSPAGSPFEIHLKNYRKFYFWLDQIYRNFFFLTYRLVLVNREDQMWVLRIFKNLFLWKRLRVIQKFSTLVQNGMVWLVWVSYSEWNGTVPHKRTLYSFKSLFEPKCALFAFQYFLVQEIFRITIHVTQLSDFITKNVNNFQKICWHFALYFNFQSTSLDRTCDYFTSAIKIRS